MSKKNTAQRKTAASWRKKTTLSPELPPGLFSRESAVYVAGNRRAEIIGCISVLEYEENCIMLRIRDGILAIQGEGMEIQLFQKDQLTVVGSIRNVAWKDEKGDVR